MDRKQRYNDTDLANLVRHSTPCPSIWCLYPHEPSLLPNDLISGGEIDLIFVLRETGGKRHAGRDACDGGPVPCLQKNKRRKNASARLKKTLDQT